VLALSNEALKLAAHYPLPAAERQNPAAPKRVRGLT
jgi:hypothetical protein